MPPPSRTLPPKTCVLIRHFKRSLLSSSSRFSQALAFPCPKTHFVNLHLRLQRANFSDPERVRNIEALEGFLDYVNSQRLVKLIFQLWLKIPAFLLGDFCIRKTCGSVFLQ